MGEYLIKGKAIFRLEPNTPSINIEEMQKGINEQEALASCVTKLASTLKVSPDRFIVHALIRNTGRTSSIVFDEQARESLYNRGIISRFWVRFHLSDTEDDLKRFGEEFHRFIGIREHRGDSFSNATIRKMREKYKEQLCLINSGVIYTINYKIKSEDTREPIEVISDRAANYLRLFGFGVQKKGAKYQLKALPCQNHLLSKEISEEFDPLGLLLFYEWKLVERDIEMETSYQFLGYVLNKHQEEYLLSMKEESLEVYLQKDDIGIPMLYVAKEDEKKAKVMLRNIGAKIITDYTEPDSYESDPLGETYYHNLENMFE